MAENICPQCGAPIDPTATECKYCGETLAVQQAAQQLRTQQNYVQQPQPIYIQQANSRPVNQQGMQTQVYAAETNAMWPIKSKAAAGVLGILLGGFGIHKFYLGKIGMGILYLCFCWTGIPSIVGFVEGIVYLCSSDESFERKNHVRAG